MDLGRERDSVLGSLEVSYDKGLFRIVGGVLRS